MTNCDVLPIRVPWRDLLIQFEKVQGEKKVFPRIQTFIYLDMLKLNVAPQLEEFQPWIIFQQDGAPPHWCSYVRRFLNATFPKRLTGRDSPTPWTPRSPDITPLDFFLWGYVNPLNPELNLICYFLALLGAHHFLHVSKIRVKLLTFRLLISYIYGAPILDVSRSHTTTQHSR